MKVIDIDGVEVFIEQTEKYIQINDIQGDELIRLWKSLKEQYPGYTVNLCFHDMLEPIEVLTTIGAEVLEDCITMQVIPHEYVPYYDAEITALEKTDFSEFAMLHDTVNPAPYMYWTSSRIWDKWDKWRIFVIRTNGKITGYTLLLIALRDNSKGEIFCIEAESKTQREALLSVAVRCAFENDKEVVIRVVDRDNLCEMEEVVAVGFREIGFYIGYSIIIPDKSPTIG
ncbi:MAG: hypothetical protein FWF14_03920 [Streptococcaceae bacterium]|nr:hypothetical protein [Streptococcaceae bacterium]